MDIERRYLSIKDASVYLGMSRQWLYKEAAAQNIPAHKLGRVWRFDKSELDQFVRGVGSRTGA